MSPEQIDHFIHRQSRWVTGAGFLFFAIGFWLEWPGAIIGWMAAWLGLSGVIFSECDWRQERGLWFLAGLFFVMSGFSCAVLQMSVVELLLNGVPLQRFFAFVDYLFGFGLLAFHCQFLIFVARSNWRHADFHPNQLWYETL